MIQMRWMGKISVVLALSLMTSCQLAPPVSSRGALSFRFQTPDFTSLAPLAFSLKSIPAGTSRFEILISGDGLSSPLTRSFDLKAGSATQQETIGDLPTGTKQVEVRAMLGEDVLASAGTSVTIEAGRVAQAELDLQALRAAVQALLETALPLDLELKLKFTGQGLESPVEKTVKIPANETAGPLGSLPLGSKLVDMQMSVSAGDDKVTAPNSSVNLDVQTSGGTLTIPTASVLRAFENDLEPLLNKANPLVLLAWIQKLRSNPDKLRELFFLLPPNARLRLRQNPLVMNDLPPESDPGPSPTPSASASAPEPTISATPAINTGLVADARLALIQVDDPEALMEHAPTDVVGEIRILNPNDSIVMAKNSVWALLVRSNYTGQVMLPYQSALRSTTGERTILFSGVGNMSKHFRVDGQDFNGEVILLNSGRVLPLASGEYQLVLRVRQAEVPEFESYEYTLKVF